MKYLILILLIPLVISCGSTAYYNNINQLQKGDDISTTKQKIDATTREAQKVTIDGTEYEVIVASVITNYKNMYNTGSPTGMGARHQVSVGSANYYMIFDSGELMYWGFLYELKRNKSELIQRIAYGIQDMELN